MLVAAFTLSCLVAVSLGAEPSCQGSPVMSFIADHANCSNYWICFYGVATGVTCGDHRHWNQETKTCVELGSDLDTCKTAKTGLLDSCRSGPEFAAKGDHCAQYYDCNFVSSPLSDRRDPLWPNAYVRECPFPKLFNSESQRCEHYSDVDCQGRFEPLDACEYENNNCHGPQCMPCQIQHASCRGKPDGLNSWSGREGDNPYFAVCQDQRVVYQGLCHSSEFPQLYNSEKRTCVENVPRQK